MTTGLTTMAEAPGFAWQDDGTLDRRAVTRCALARVCGVCSESLGRPIVFVGDADEDGRNEFHAPPLHEACAQQLLTAAGPGHVVVRTGGFEFVRPGRDDPDPMPRFAPNSRL